MTLPKRWLDDKGRGDELFATIAKAVKDAVASRWRFDDAAGEDDARRRNRRGGGAAMTPYRPAAGPMVR